MSFAIGDYTAQRQLAVSETSSVWSGHHTGSGRRVTLKIMSVFASDQIRREAALAGFIEHPHLVSAYDVAIGDEWCALVLEPADGGSLAQLLATGCLSDGQTITVVAGIAAALAVAHERGLTHGDLSPSNVLLDHVGKPMLADLGAARAAAEVNVQICATPGYVAPEVARGATPNAASDIFSLGAVALHCLTGRPAWPADDLRDVVIQATAGQWPDPGPHAGASARLLLILRAMLQVDPLARPGAASVLLDLQSAGVPAAVEPRAAAASDGRGRHAAAADHGGSAADADSSSSDSGPTFAVAGDRSTARTQLRMRDEAVPTEPPRRSGPPGLNRFVGNRQNLRRYVVIPLIATLLLAAAVTGGLWWARSAQTPPLAVTESGSTVSDAGISSPEFAGGSGSASLSADLQSVSSGSSGQDQTWQQVMTDLDRLRSAAFTARDVQALQQVYVAGTEALQTDVDRILALLTQGLRVDGLEHQISQVARLARPGIVIQITDTMPTALIRTDSGGVVGQTAERGSTTRTVELVAVGAGFRIKSMTTQ